jgi:hypothetical protein
MNLNYVHDFLTLFAAMWSTPAPVPGVVREFKALLTISYCTSVRQRIFQIVENSGGKLNGNWPFCLTLPFNFALGWSILAGIDMSLYNSNQMIYLIRVC